MIDVALYRKSNLIFVDETGCDGSLVPRPFRKKTSLNSPKVE